MSRQMDLDYYRGLLEKERSRMLRQLKSTEEANDQSDTLGELADYDDHPADVATETFEREKESALRANARHTLERIEEALRKMEQGTYGQCDICGQDIPLGRLEAVPYATLCVRCQADVEGT